MINLKDKVVAVTGGSRGIGAAVAKMAAQAGADVAINYIKHEKQAEEIARYVMAEGKRALVYQGDMSHSIDARGFIEQTITAFGRLDILVANAGIWTYGAIGNMNDELWDETMAVNARGVFNIINAAVPRMRESGNIVVVSSTAGQRGEAYHSHYAASKGALLAFVRSLAVELAPRGIRVNAVAPGWVSTELNDLVFKDPLTVEKIRNDIPLKRIASPEDVAGPILFLASDLARHITGATLNVNGGSVLN